MKRPLDLRLDHGDRCPVVPHVPADVGVVGADTLIFEVLLQTVKSVCVPAEAGDEEDRMPMEMFALKYRSRNHLLRDKLEKRPNFRQKSRTSSHLWSPCIVL